MQNKYLGENLTWVKIV